MNSKFDTSEQFKIIIVSITMMLFVSISVLATSLWLLYQSMFSQEVEKLQTLVERQINVLEPLKLSEIDNQQKLNITNIKILKAFSSASNFGQTGEFVLGIKRLDNIEFLSTFRFPLDNQVNIIPLDSAFAAPMRRALAKERGWLVGQDYRGEEVLAAYQYLKSSDLGVVAKIDIKEVNAPFIYTAIKTAIIAVVLIGIGGLLMFYRTIPIIRRLKTNQETFNNLLESSPDAMIIVNSSREIIYNNQNAEVMFGYLTHELIELFIEDLIPKNFREHHPQMIASYFKNPSKRTMGFGLELFGLSKSGKTFPCEISLHPILTEGGLQVAATIRDISERKSLELRLMQSEKMEAMSKISGSIAHEFNNLLGIIMGFSSLLKHQLVKQPKLYDYTKQIITAGERGAELTKKMLAFSTVLPTFTTVFDINNLLNDKWDMFKELLSENIILTSDFSDDLLLINVDMSELQNAIIHLCTNAKFAVQGTHKEPKITIQTNHQTIGSKEALIIGLIPGDYVLLSVIDNGTGMDLSVKNRIFEPFFSTKEFGAATGLGLSQVFGLVKRYQGTIRVESKIESGTKFVIYLPRS
jgi:PAS domain S-box-containing protein